MILGPKNMDKDYHFGTVGVVSNFKIDNVTILEVCQLIWNISHINEMKSILKVQEVKRQMWL